jgi:nitrate/nitrite-specific signal transduction histidine kinase
MTRKRRLALDLRSKILVWTFIPTALPLTAVVVLAVLAFRQLAFDLVIQRDRELTRLLADQLGVQMEAYAGSRASLARAEGLYGEEILSQRSLFLRIVSAVRTRTGDTGSAYIVDGAGKVIFHSDSAHVGEDFSAQDVVRRALQGESGTVRTRNAAGVETVASFAPVGGMTWGLVTEQPWSSLIGSVVSYERLILLLVGIGLLVPVLIVAVGVQRLTRPIQGLITASQEIADGNFGQRVEAATGDELEDLAEQFNRMAARLEQSYLELQHEVDERTRALATLSAVTAAGSLMLDVRHVLEASLDEVLRTLDLPAGGVFVREAEPDPRHLAASRGLSDRLSEQLALSAGEGQPLARVAVTTGPIVLDLVAEGLMRLGVQEIAARRYLMAVPLTARGEAHGVLFVTSPVREALDDQVAQLLTTVGQQLGVAIQSQRLYRAQQRRAEQFRVISEVGRRITSLHEVEDVVREIVRPVHDRLGYSLVGIGLIEGEMVVMKAGAGAGWEQPEFEPPHFRIGRDGIIGKVAAEGKTLLVPDVTQDPRYIGLADSVDTRSELAIPLRTQEAVFGVLDVQSDRLNAFDDDERVVLESLAAQAAIAIDNARLYARAREAAVLEERNRLARDLHDAVSQTLWTASLLAEVVPDQVRDSPREALDSLTQLRQLTRGALAEMRMLLLELRPAALEHADLAELLRQLADGVSSRKKIEIHLALGRHLLAPGEVKVALYRIAQEALNNAAKHSQAKEVWITLAGGDTGVLLEVRDSGRGFDMERAPTRGLGLNVMRERAQAIGGMLVIESAAGQGTRVAVHWPAHEE